MVAKTVQQYIDQARVLLQDTTSAPRYSEEELRQALSLAISEAYRLRPDFFVDEDLFIQISADLTVVPNIPKGYSLAFVYFMVGHVQLRDAEDLTDARASAFLQKFASQLLTTS